MGIAENIRTERISKGYSQEKLAEESGLSLRTIQRIENNVTTARGHSLMAVANALQVTVQILQTDSDNDLNNDNEQITRLNLLNLSILISILIPYMNLILPLILWWKNRHFEILDTYARRIINFQIVWTITTCITLTIAPFVQLLFISQKDATTLSPVLITYLVLLIYNFTKTFIVSEKIKKGQLDTIYPKVPHIL